MSGLIRFFRTAGLFSSVNDLAAFGKAILNSTLLPNAITRRWIKPRSFTDNEMESVGAPWEIVRIDIGPRNVDLYTKDGNWGGYASYIGLIPDFNVGFVIMAASLPRPQAQMTTYAVRRLMESIFLPALEDVARQQATADFSGTYGSTVHNSSLTIVTDAEPGLKISSWISEGVDVLKTMRRTLSALDEPPDVDFRLYPNLLYSNSHVGFAAVSGFLTGSSPSYPAWESIDGLTYGSVGIDNFVFEIDPKTRRAINVQPLAWRTTLEREEKDSR